MESKVCGAPGVGNCGRCFIPGLKLDHYRAIADRIMARVAGLAAKHPVLAGAERTERHAEVSRFADEPAYVYGELTFKKNVRFDPDDCLPGERCGNHPVPVAPDWVELGVSLSTAYGTGERPHPYGCVGELAVEYDGYNLLTIRENICKIIDDEKRRLPPVRLCEEPPACSQASPARSFRLAVSEHAGPSHLPDDWTAWDIPEVE